MRVQKAALSLLLVGGAAAFAPTMPFAIQRYPKRSLEMAASSEKEVRQAISQLQPSNVQETLDSIEPFLRDEASAKFYATAKSRLSSKAWAMGVAIPENFAKVSTPASAPETAAESSPELEPVAEEAADTTPEPVAEEETPEPVAEEPVVAEEAPSPVEEEPVSDPEPVAEAPAAAPKKITPALIKELRELTGAGMMDCKKALTETDGDVEQAIENMRKSGALKAAKKATKVAAEGQIIIKESDGTAALVEVNCQTDFVAKDATFLAFANEVAEAAVRLDGVENMIMTMAKAIAASSNSTARPPER